MLNAVVCHNVQVGDKWKNETHMSDNDPEVSQQNAFLMITLTYSNILAYGPIQLSQVNTAHIQPTT